MSEARPPARRFPIVLTLVTAIAFAILCALGTWQMQRLAWKEDLLARLERLKAAPATPLGPVLSRAKAGEDVAWTRVETSCKPGAARKDAPLVYGVRDGAMVWRAQAVCELPSGPNGAILVDLGVVDALTGRVEGDGRAFAPPARVSGVLAALNQLGGKERARIVDTAMGANPARYVLMAEATTPAVAGVTPAPLPAEISNRHLEYALTWFGLAVTLLFIYAAMLWRKMRS